MLTDPLWAWAEKRLDGGRGARIIGLAPKAGTRLPLAEAGPMKSLHSRIRCATNVDAFVRILSRRKRLLEV